ncbi:hypothetical protein B0H13DRAFT_1900879 [Mycena leptocephala]|nr:hypothetical protein B0H13DRAFT_1900879 [Mycena leptocephala]
MVRLESLVAGSNVNLSQNALKGITFKLDRFAKLDALSGECVAFLCKQSMIEELVLFGEFPCAILPDKFGELKRLKALPDVSAEILNSNSVANLWMSRRFSGDEWEGRLEEKMINGMIEALGYVTSLRLQLCDLFKLVSNTAWDRNVVRLTLDEDDSWGSGCFDGATLPVLRSVRFVSAERGRYSETGLTREHGDAYQKKIRDRCHSTHVTDLHFCATNGCTTWAEWHTSSIRFDLETCEHGWIV